MIAFYAASARKASPNCLRDRLFQAMLRWCNNTPTDYESVIERRIFPVAVAALPHKRPYSAASPSNALENCADRDANAQ
jgi:hypothetical protein